LLIKFRNRSESAAPPTATRKAAPVTATVGTSKKSDDGAFNPWDLAQIWIESVSKEESTRKQWEQMYGWMADYDARVFLYE
jgi:hypothetical protein